jgi:hypothetical protein
MREASLQIVRKEHCSRKYRAERPEKFQLIVNIAAEQADCL